MMTRHAAAIGSLLLLLLAAAPARADCEAPPDAGAKDPLIAEMVAYDELIEMAYVALCTSLPAEERPALKLSQERWLERRFDSVRLPGGTGDVKRETEKRLRLLRGRPVNTGEKPPKLRAQFVQQEGADDRYRVDFDLIRLVEPAMDGEKSFNAKIDAIVQAAPLGASTDKPAKTGGLQAMHRMEPLYASAEMISARSHSSRLNGDTNWWIEEWVIINFDFRSGVDLKAEDFFSAETMAVLHDECSEAVDEQVAKIREYGDRQADVEDRDRTVRDAVYGMENWEFDAEAATLRFFVHEATGGGTAPVVTCVFAREELKTMVKADSVFPN